MPLSLAQRLTPSTSLSPPTLLLTEPQQHIDIPLRGLNTSDEYANGVQSRGESLQNTLILCLFLIFLFFFVTLPVQYFLSNSG